MYGKSQGNVSQSEMKPAIFTSEFRNGKIRVFVSQKTGGGESRVCKKHKKGPG